MGEKRIGEITDIVDGTAVLIAKSIGEMVDSKGNRDIYCLTSKEYPPVYCLVRLSDELKKRGYKGIDIIAKEIVPKGAIELNIDKYARKYINSQSGS